MMYDSLYERCSGPFTPDINRGHWSVPNDFIYAGLSLGFRLDIFRSSWNRETDAGVISVLPKYLICMVLYVIPMLLIQSFMGQFSNSGFITAFRLSPLFKGIGFVTLVLNICVLIYFSLFALIPLVYLFGSINTTLPWDCKRLINLNETENLDEIPCRLSNETECSTYSTIRRSSLFDHSNIFGMSWQMIIAVISVWVIIGLVVYVFSNIEKIGKVIRYSVRIVVVLLLLVIIRISFLPNAGQIYSKIFMPNWNDFVNDIKSVPAHGISALDPGWGLFITLASFNKFNTNIWRSSWFIGIGQILIIFGLDILEKFTVQYLKVLSFDAYHGEGAKYRTLYFSSGSIIADMAWPNLWSMIFYFMLFLAAIILMIIQLYSILYSICDELISLRQHRIQVTMILLSVMAVCSLYLTSYLGINNFGYLQLEIFVIQSLFDYLLIIIVLWIYGHNNFQRDIEFMINGYFSNWKIYSLKFLTPAVMLISLVMALIFYSITVVVFNNIPKNLLECILKPFPWLCLIIYAIYCLLKVKGSFRIRFIKCYQPNDWYPIEDEDQQKYKVVLDNANMMHQLNTSTRNEAENENI